MRKTMRGGVFARGGTHAPCLDHRYAEGTAELARSGRAAEARWIQSGLLAQWRSKRRGAYELALVTAGLGDNDQAFQWLDRAVDDLSLYGFIMYPLFKELQADPRFEQFRERLAARSQEGRAAPSR
jgi:hypothetical protein